VGGTRLGVFTGSRGRILALDSAKSCISNPQDDLDKFEELGIKKTADLLHLEIDDFETVYFFIYAHRIYIYTTNWNWCGHFHLMSAHEDIEELTHVCTHTPTHAHAHILPVTAHITGIFVRVKIEQTQ